MYVKMLVGNQQAKTVLLQLHKNSKMNPSWHKKMTSVDRGGKLVKYGSFSKQMNHVFPWTRPVCL